MDISFLPYLHYLSFLISTGFIVYILIKDYKSLINIACSLFLFCFSLWSIGMTFIHNINTSLEMVDFWYNVNCFGWIAFSYFFFWFTVLFIDDKKILKNKWIFVLLFIFPAVLVYKKWTGDILDYYILMPYGWTYVWKNSIWTLIFYIYYIGTMTCSIILLYNYWRKIKFLIKKKQAKIILLSVLLALPLGSILNVVLPEIGVFFVPPIGNFVSLIWVAGVVYAMSKYDFLNITPENTANNVITKMSDALIMLDSQGYIVNVNLATLKLLGYKEKEIVGKSISILFVGSKLRDKILEKSKNKEVYNNEELVLKTKGNFRNIPVLFSNSFMKNIDNSLAGIVCVAKDVSDIKKIEKNLENNNKKLEENIKKLELSEKKINRAIDKIDGEKRNIDLEKNKISSIISSFNDPIIVVDKYSQISYINKEAKKVFGFSDDLIGKKYFLRNFSMSNLELVSKVDFSVLRGNELISGDTRDGVEELVVHGSKKDLTYKVITAKMTEESNYYGLIKIFHNLTKEKEMDKLKSEFISIAAHQLRTPLSAVKWVMKMILDGDVGDLSKEQSELLEKGYSNNERMIKLVNDLLYVSRIEEGRFGYTLKDDDYLEVVKRSINDQKKVFKKKNLSFTCNIPEKLPKLNIDRDRIDLVLKNIFSNCYKYTPENGKIHLTITRGEEFIETKIKDNGMGVSKNEKSRLFEKFFRASNVLRTQTTGSGLGLYITKNIIKKHEGEITIKSQEGKGTEVIFTLPIKRYQNFNI